MTEAGWTRTKPTVAGWYWYKDPDYPVPTILYIQVILEPTAFWGSGVKHALKSVHGEWLGPISPDSFQQGRVAGAQDVLESFKKHHDACNDFRHCECAGGFWYEHIGKAWMDEKAAQAAQDEKGVGDGN